MKKELCRELVSATIVNMYIESIIDSPEFIFFDDDRGLSDTFFDIYCLKNGRPKDITDLTETGVSCLNAGMITCYSQRGKAGPVRDFSKAQMSAIISIYQDDIVDCGRRVFQQLGWGYYDTLDKKAQMYRIIAWKTACIFLKENGQGPLSIDTANDYAYFMFNIGNTIMLNGNFVRARDF